jgi:hypothetical protein
MNRYVVISFNTKGETFLDPVIARCREEAHKIVEVFRNATPIRALTPIELHAIADNISDSTDEDILEYNDRAFSRDAVPTKPKRTKKSVSHAPYQQRRSAKVN